MIKNQLKQTRALPRMLKKIFLSGFVVFTFVAYAIQQRFTKPDSQISLISTNSSLAAPQSASSSGTAPASSTQAMLMVQPSATLNQGMYKDGVYTGPQVDVYYGLVEVQVIIQNGKIANVQFLQYPNDRRTSRQINSFAMPYLQQEAIQAQSAHINMISGATFTSEGFAMSLNSALASAKN